MVVVASSCSWDNSSTGPGLLLKIDGRIDGAIYWGIEKRERKEKKKKKKKSRSGSEALFKKNCSQKKIDKCDALRHAAWMSDRIRREFAISLFLARSTVLSY